MTRPRDSYGIGQIDELVAWCKANAIWASCAVCERAVRQCLSEGDGPIRIRRIMLDANRDGPRPICARCLADPNARAREAARKHDEELRDVANLDWNKPGPKGTIPLWLEALELREANGWSWQQIADDINERHGLEVLSQSVRTAVVGRQERGTTEGDGRKVRRERAASSVAQATSPVDPTAEGNGRSQDGCATDDNGGQAGSLPHGPAKGEEMPLNLGRAGAAMIPPRRRGNGLITVHVQKEFMEVWIAAFSEDEFLIHVEEVKNFLDIVVNAKKGPELQDIAIDETEGQDAA